MIMEKYNISKKHYYRLYTNFHPEDKVRANNKKEALILFQLKNDSLREWEDELLLENIKQV